MENDKDLIIEHLKRCIEGISLDKTEVEIEAGRKTIATNRRIKSIQNETMIEAISAARLNALAIVVTNDKKLINSYIQN